MPTDGRASQRARLYCVVHRDRADALLAGLRGHFARQPLVAVLVERRARIADALVTHPLRPAHRRAPVAERDASRALPPALRQAAPHVRLVQPLAPLRRVHEDSDVRDLIARTIAMEAAATSELWWRLSPRTLARLGLRLGRAPGDAAAPTLLGRILDELPEYDPAHDPLSPWLDAVVDRYAEELATVPVDEPVRCSALRAAA